MLQGEIKDLRGEIKDLCKRLHKRSLLTISKTNTGTLWLLHKLTLHELIDDNITLWMHV